MDGAHLAGARSLMMTNKITITIYDFLISNSNQQRLSCAPGERLMEVCEEVGTSIAFGCGQGACGSCRVRVLAGADAINTSTDDERDFLDSLGADSEERLACCMKVYGDIELTCG